MEKKLLDYHREIIAICKNGLAFSKDHFDIERFKQIEELSISVINEHSDLSKEYLNKIFSAEEGYSTPKIDVRGAVFKENKVLLVKENATDCWTLPGGYVDVNEPLSISVQREVLEESGLIVSAKKVIGIYDHRQHGYKAHLYHFYKIYILCDLMNGVEKTSNETSEVKFFSLEEIDSLKLDEGRLSKKHLLVAFNHYINPSLQTEFD